ncbi:PucR family transcriptional regulator [Ectobacillus ponti]|uniref:Helix-turn-helix domain-containing protein n=1 Tax=Ectobacillus ponti TaxID=2961894 RepID=A0AA42BS82_9BACI|nr:helix-turn-helix domain-containing protein [Ectobacillus ponti]MCP8968173.1 helix-turn-helix domain-containing protein [Ectobacillus ponti]
MIDKLRQHYGQAVVTEAAAGRRESYHWYSDPHNQIIGIEKGTLSPQEEALLQVFLTPVALEDVYRSPEQQLWQRLLFGQEEAALSALQPSVKKVRFLHFSLKEPFFEKQALEEALKGLLETAFVMAWQDHSQGVIVETYSYDEEIAIESDAFETLVSDFFITPHVLVGRLLPVNSALPAAFRYEQFCFGIAKTHLRRQHMYRLEDALPYLFLAGHAGEAADFMLQTVKDEKDLLATVRAYLDCNMNVSLAAKQLYMHRNSVLYRVDKFIEKTGIDIKSFRGAVSVYMAILFTEAK